MSSLLQNDSKSTSIAPVENLKVLTSLRFFAAAMIVLLHSAAFTWDWTKSLPATLSHGVSFFFVLSGFILTHAYQGRAMPKLKIFLWARFSRLWPVHFFAIVLLYVLIPRGVDTFDGPGIFSRWVVLFFNLTLSHSLFPYLEYIFSWNAVSWSISTEFCFYLVFPLLVGGIRFNWAWKLVLAVAVACAFVAFLHFMNVPAGSGNEEINLQFATYANPIMRIPEFVLGMATWVIWDRYLRRRQLSKLAWTVVEALAIGTTIAWMFIVFPQVMGMLNSSILSATGSAWILAVLIACMASGKGYIGSALSLRFVVFLGEVSFSVYMLHQIILKVFIFRFDLSSPPAWLYFSTVLAAATLSFYFIEKPAQRRLRELMALPPKAPSALASAKT